MIFIYFVLRMAACDRSFNSYKKQRVVNKHKDSKEVFSVTVRYKIKKKQ